MKEFSRAASNTSVVSDNEAPELIQGKPLTIAHDYWCLGIMLYEMLFGPTPFECEERSKTELFIQQLEVCYPENIEVSKDTKDLIGMYP